MCGSKKSYCERRGIHCNLTNKRPGKLKDKLRELEESLNQNRVVCSRWEANRLRLLLSKGVLVTIGVNELSDVTNIGFDRSFVAKIQNEVISDGMYRVLQYLNYFQSTDFKLPKCFGSVIFESS